LSRRGLIGKELIAICRKLLQLSFNVLGLSLQPDAVALGDELFLQAHCAGEVIFNQDNK